MTTIICRSIMASRHQLQELTDVNAVVEEQNEKIQDLETEMSIMKRQFGRFQGKQVADIMALCHKLYRLAQMDAVIEEKNEKIKALETELSILKRQFEKRQMGDMQACSNALLHERRF